MPEPLPAVPRNEEIAKHFPSWALTHKPENDEEN
jgi:hypothetical protein